MKKMRSNISFFFFLFLAAPLLKAQDTLSYNAFIKNIHNHHPLVLRAKNIRLSGDFVYQSAKGAFDPVLSGSYNEKYFDTKNYYSILNAAIKQPLYTSQYVVAGYDYAQGAFVDPETQTTRSGMPFLGVETALLQGLAFDKRRADLLKAKSYKSYYEAEQNVLLNELLYNASLHYFEWLFSLKELSLYNHFTSLAEQRFRAISALSKIGELASVDSVEAAILFHTRSLEMQSVKISNQKTKTNLLTFNWMGNTSPSASSAELFPADSLEIYYEKSRLLFNSFLRDTVSVNPYIRKYQSLQSILNIEKRYKAELIKPKLDVKYNFLANNSPGFNSSFNANNYRWGVSFSLPVFLRTSVNEYKISKLNAQNNQFELNNRTNEIQFKEQVIWQNIAVLNEQLSNSEKNVRYSKLLLQAEQKKFDHGESSLFLLNTRESKLLEAELKLAEYRLKFIKSVLELVYLKGGLNYSL